MALAEKVYGLTHQFPADERFGLTAQARRAVVSVASCIAEGNARSSMRDYLRFLSMSSGSLAEVETQMLLAARLGYVSADDLTPALASLHGVARQLQALKKSLANKLSVGDQFPVPRSPFPAT
jgi:four helix bundle protein